MVSSFDSYVAALNGLPLQAREEDSLHNFARYVLNK